MTDFLVADFVAGAFAAAFFAAGAVRAADLLVTFAEAVEVFEAVLLTAAFLRVVTFDEVARAGLAAGLVGEVVRRAPDVAGRFDREAPGGRLTVPAPAEALPVPAARARVVFGLPVVRVPLDDERRAVAVVLLVLAAFPAARLALARPEAVA